MNSVQLIDTISENIVGYGKHGHRAKRWSFSDYMHGGDVQSSGYSQRQGPQEPRVGEWTKMMIQGSGFFAVRDEKKDETYFTRLGDFHIDAVGNLSTREGFKVMGIPLAGAATRLHGHNPANPDYSPSEVLMSDPFAARTQNVERMNPPGAPVGQPEAINIGIDPRNGLYLGHYEKIHIGEDGVIYGVDGQNLVSLYKIQVSNFNNPEGLYDVKDGTYFKASAESGAPSLFAADSLVIPEALEKSNTWLKTETHYLTEAQRYYQAATQMHKLADKITGTAIEMIQ